MLRFFRLSLGLIDALEALARLRAWVTGVYRDELGLYRAL